MTDNSTRKMAQEAENQLLAVLRLLQGQLIATYLELSEPLECGGLAPLCYRAERGHVFADDIARSARRKRRSAVAVHGGICLP